MNEDTLIDATHVLAVALNVAYDSDLRKLAETRNAKAGIRVGSSPEIRVMMICERAGITVEYRDDMQYPSITAAFPVATGNRIGFVPHWVAPFYEATIGFKTAVQVQVLKRARANTEWRAAGLTVWRLGGLQALSSWVAP